MSSNSQHNPSLTLRGKVAREAAALLYFGLEKEYKQAKLKAADNLRVRVLPSNLEVALELDNLAAETEGESRTKRLVSMRKEALEIMRLLHVFCPVLLGSVWRGTIKQASDIDIEVFGEDPKRLISILEDHGVKILKTEHITVNEHGKTTRSTHIYALTATKQLAEITLRNQEEKGKKRLCDTFGDQIKGLNIQELERVLKENPAQRFLPA